MKAALTFSVIVCFWGCSKKENPQPDKESPSIQITKPIAGQTYVNGDTIHLQAVISDKDGLHEHVVQLSSMSDSVLFSNEDHGHESPLTLSMDIPVRCSKQMEAKLIVKANDHSGNIGEQMILIQLRP